MNVEVRPASLQDGVAVLSLLEDVGYYPSPSRTPARSADDHGPSSWSGWRRRRTGASSGSRPLAALPLGSAGCSPASTSSRSCPTRRRASSARCAARPSAARGPWARARPQGGEPVHPAAPRRPAASARRGRVNETFDFPGRRGASRRSSCAPCRAGRGAVVCHATRSTADDALQGRLPRGEALQSAGSPCCASTSAGRPQRGHARPRHRRAGGRAGGLFEMQRRFPGLPSSSGLLVRLARRAGRRRARPARARRLRARLSPADGRPLPPRPRRAAAPLRPGENDAFGSGETSAPRRAAPAAARARRRRRRGSLLTGHLDALQAAVAAGGIPPVGGSGLAGRADRAARAPPAQTRSVSDDVPKESFRCRSRSRRVTERPSSGRRSARTA